jgi:hypothetical protein
MEIAAAVFRCARRARTSLRWISTSPGTSSSALFSTAAASSLAPRSISAEPITPYWATAWLIWRFAR